MRKDYKAGGSAKKDTHVTKDGRTKAKKGLYYYMNRAKKRGTSKPGKGSVTDKALKAQSAKTAKKPKRRNENLLQRMAEVQRGLEKKVRVPLVV